MSDFHNKWSDVKGPRFQPGDRVVIIGFTQGHDNHEPGKAYIVETSRAASYDGFHKLKGLASNWPGTRLRKA